MDFASTTRADKDMTRWKEIIVKSSVVPKQPCKVMRFTRLDKTRKAVHSPVP